MTAYPHRGAILLRPDQEQAVSRIYASIREGHRAILSQAQTGFGKGHCIAAMLADCASRGKRSAVVTHLSEINRDLIQRIRSTGIEPRVLMGAAAEGPADSLVWVVSEQTAARRGLVLDNVRLCIRDECFPAGTLVDGRPIESLRPGDTVTAYDETTGKLEKRNVLLSMRSHPRAMVRVYSDGNDIACTAGHPFFTRRGWVIASELTEDDFVLRSENHGTQKTNVGNDLQGMRDPDHAHWRKEIDGPEEGARILLEFSCTQLLGKSESGLHDCHEQARRAGAHASEQSDAHAWHSREDDRYVARDRTPPSVSRWQRETASCDASSACRSARMADRSADQDGTEEARDPDLLQGRYCEPGHDDRRGSGRRFPWCNGTQSAGCEERGVLAWHRVDRVEVLEPGSNGRFGGVCADGFVYNIEVEGLHTYVAGRFVVHNCHRQQSVSALAVAAACPPDAIHVGFTATPARGDGKPLDFYKVLHAGAQITDLVDAGLIAPMRAFSPQSRGTGLAADPVEAWPRGPDGRPLPGVLFADSVAHSKALVPLFAAAGVTAVHCDAGTPNRAAVIDRFNAGGPGSPDILTCWRLLQEGVDTRRAVVCMTASAVGHIGIIRQMWGRVRRLFPGADGAPKTALAIDLRDNLRNLNVHPDADLHYSLDGAAGITVADAAESAAFPMRCCQECFAWSRSGAPCQVCGALVPPPPPPVLSKRALVEVLHQRQRLAGPAWEEWLAHCRPRLARGATPQKVAAAWMFERKRPPAFTVQQAVEALAAGEAVGQARQAVEERRRA